MRKPHRRASQLRHRWWTDALEKKRKSIQDGISDKQKEDRQKRQDLNDMKKKLGFQSEAEIDAEIKKIETSMQTESHTLKKEKEMIAKIQELRKSKPMVSKYAAMESGQGGGENAGVDSLKNNIEDIKKELVEVREAKKIQSQAYSTLMEARQKVMGDVPKMFEERAAPPEVWRGTVPLTDKFHARAANVSSMHEYPPI